MIARLSGIRAVFLILTFVITGLFAQDETSKSFSLKYSYRIDSLSSRLKLQNPFLKNKYYWSPLYNNAQFSPGVTSGYDGFSTQYSPQPIETLDERMDHVPLIEWDITPQARNEFLLDYRESSLYTPENVRDYLEFKMGRDRYVPLASFAALSYLSAIIYQRYGHLLKTREEVRYQGLQISPMELHMMDILWDKGEYEVREWYKALVEDPGVTPNTYIIFQENVKSLDNKYLIKSRNFPNGEVKYYPALSRQDLVLKLKNEVSVLDGIENPGRLKYLQKLIGELESRE